MIENNIVIEHRNDALRSLKQKINGYRRGGREIYIGVTSNPESRWAQHYRAGWTKMVLLYEAYRPDIAIDMEQELIAHAHQSNFILSPVNIGSGGEGIVDREGSCYLYVLVRQAPAPTSTGRRRRPARG